MTHRSPVTNHIFSLTQEFGLRCKDCRMAYQWPQLDQKPGLLLLKAAVRLHLCLALILSPLGYMSTCFLI